MYGYEVFRNKNSGVGLLSFRPSMTGTELRGTSSIRNDKISFDISLDVDVLYDRKILVLGTCTSYAYLKNTILPVSYTYQDLNKKDTYLKLRTTSYGELFFILEDSSIINIKTK